MTYDLIIKNGTCLTPSGRIQTDIGVNDGKISHIGEIKASDDDTIIDATNQYVLPGLIDSQVHFREPGNEHKEDLESGTKSAILGGVTAIFEMPNTSPPTTSKEALEDKINRCKDRAWCDFAFFVGGTPEHRKDWSYLEKLDGCAGIKIFMGSSTGNLLVSEDEAVEEILSRSTRRCAVHSEDENRLNQRKHLAKEGKHPKYHPIWRDEETAFNSTKRLINIAKKTQHPVHVLHITTKQEIEFLAQNKDIASIEVLPQHLTFTDKDYETKGSLIQMNPPIRGKEHQDALWEAIQNGTVDVLGSDHAPHTIEEKQRQYPESPSGMTGVQTIIPIMLNHINNGKLTLERLIELMCTNPVRIYNVQNKGQIAKGFDADFTIVDMEMTKTITNEQMASKSGWTPYDGMQIKGWPTHTIIRGNIVMANDNTIGDPLGTTVKFSM